MFFINYLLTLYTYFFLRFWLGCLWTCCHNLFGLVFRRVVLFDKEVWLIGFSYYAIFLILRYAKIFILDLIKIVNLSFHIMFGFLAFFARNHNFFQIIYFLFLMLIPYQIISLFFLLFNSNILNLKKMYWYNFSLIKR